MPMTGRFRLEPRWCYGTTPACRFRILRVDRVRSSRPCTSGWIDTNGSASMGWPTLPRVGPPPVLPGKVRARIVALTRCTPPTDTGMSHWSSREMAAYLKRVEGIHVSHNYIAGVWRENDLQPHRQGTFKLSTDPNFEAKVMDVVGLYLDPPEGAIVLSLDELCEASHNSSDVKSSVM